MTKLTVVLLLKALEGRGAERMVATLARAYIEMNYSVHVVCLENTKKMPLDSRVKHHLVSYYETFSKQQIEEGSIQDQAYKIVAKRIDEYILKNIGQPDLILVNIYKLNWIMSYSRLTNIVNVLHTALSRQFEAQLVLHPVQTIAHLKRVYGAHPCSCVSIGARKDLLTIIGNDTTNTTTIYNPCDSHAIKKEANRVPNTLPSGLTVGGYIIHVGSFDTMKNHRDLLQAYAKTKRRYPLVLVGTGKLEARMKQFVAKLKIEDCVRFLGFQINPYPLIAESRLLVLSSKFEGFGYVIAEAQILEIPVISTDCPFGPRELLPSNNLVAVNDVNGLAELMNQAIENPIDYKVDFNEQFLPERIAEQYLDFGQVKH